MDYATAKNYKHFMKLASKDNDGSTTDCTADYSSASASFQVKPAANDIVSIERVIISMSDTNINSADEYGAITALTNGINVYVRDGDDTIVDTLTGFAVKTNGDWATHCHDLNYHDSFANGIDYVSVRWTFARSGYPIILRGSEGHYIEVEVNDNFTGLATHRFFFQGYYLDEQY